MINKIIIQDCISRNKLYQFELSQSELAFQKAMELEKLGLDVEIVRPNTIHTLANDLGVSTEHLEIIHNEINSEVESH